MASNVPGSLKSADVGRFALRAAQMEKVKPAVAYWCNYWIVQQIMIKSLHNVDDESKAYTTRLMDKLEQMKLSYGDDDAITDDVAGRLLIEQFGLDIFRKAENTMRANKVSKQTADTFLASATFLELLGIWPPIDSAITTKIKFAKYHALRIAKALKAGEDPNLTNPSTEPVTSTELAPALDPNDPDVQALGGLVNSPNELGGATHQVSIEDAPDEQDAVQPTLAQSSTLEESLHPSQAPSQPDSLDTSSAQQPLESYYHGGGNGEVSPLGPDSADNVPSESGGYFPHMPPNDQSSVPSPHQAPPTILEKGVGFQAPPSVSPVASSMSPPQVPSGLPFSVPPHGQSRVSEANNQSLPISSQALYNISPTIIPSHHHPNNPPTYSALPSSNLSAPLQPQENFVPDEEAIAKAQKHARWAISALNFEDINTAISELEGALSTLRGR